MKPTLVTGANGHVGNNLCRLLVARGREGRVRVARPDGPAGPSNPPGFRPGPRFWKPSESVHQVEQFLNHGSPIYFDGGFGVVDVEDVARGAILAMDKGRTGERYLLSGENVTVKGLFDLMAEATGLPAPRVKLPVGVLRAGAAAMELASKLTGARPLIDRSQVDEFAGKYGYFDSGKAERELGYTYLPARETVRRTIAWLVARGFVSERRQRALRLDPALRNPAAA